MTGRLDEIKRREKWQLVRRAVWKWTRRVRVGLPVLLTLMTWRSRFKQATSWSARSAD